MPTERPVIELPFGSRRALVINAPILEQVQNEDELAEQTGDDNDADAEEPAASSERPPTPRDEELNTTRTPDIILGDTNQEEQESEEEDKEVSSASADENKNDDEDKDDDKDKDDDEDEGASSDTDDKEVTPVSADEKVDEDDGDDGSSSTTSSSSGSDSDSESNKDFIEPPSSAFLTDDDRVPKWINTLLKNHIDEQKFNLLFTYMKSEGNAMHKIVDELHTDEDLRRVACVSQCNLYMLVKDLHDAFEPGAEDFTKHVLTDSKKHVQTYLDVASNENSKTHHLRKAAKNISRHGTWQVLQYCMQTAEYEEKIDQLTAALLQIRETFLSRYLPPLEDLKKRLEAVHEFQDEITRDVSQVIIENHPHPAQFRFGTKSKADPSISSEYHTRYVSHIAKSLNKRIHDLVALKEDIHQSIQELHNIDRRIDNLQVILLKLRIRARSFFSIFHGLHLTLAFFDEDLEHHDKNEDVFSRSKHHLESIQVVLNAYDNFDPGTECHLDKSWMEPLNGDPKFAVPP